MHESSKYATSLSQSFGVALTIRMDLLLPLLLVLSTCLVESKPSSNDNALILCAKEQREAAESRFRTFQECLEYRYGNNLEVYKVIW